MFKFNVMSQNESTTVLVTDAKNLTLIDASRENSPWCYSCSPTSTDSQNIKVSIGKCFPWSGQFQTKNIAKIERKWP